MPKKLTTGERIVRKLIDQIETGVLDYDVTSALIDAAVRKAAWEGWGEANLSYSYYEEGNLGGMEDVVEDFEAKYGPRPGGNGK